jgi:hypothetical protein
LCVHKMWLITCTKVILLFLVKKKMIHNMYKTGIKPLCLRNAFGVGAMACNLIYRKTYAWLWNADPMRISI